MISTLIFDVGGVLIRTEDRAGRQTLERRLGLSTGEAEYLVFNSKMGTAAQLGQVSPEELWAWLQAHLQLDDVGLAQFQEEFWVGDQLNSALLALIQSLKPRYQTAIISNFMSDLHHVITDIYPIAGAFDLIVGSAYEGVMKPDAKIFERTLKRLKRRPEETVFVDDFAHNVAGARAVGMHAIHYTPPVDIKAELARLGVIPDL